MAAGGGVVRSRGIVCCLAVTLSIIRHNDVFSW